MATLVIALVSVGLLVTPNYVGSISTILTDAINSIGPQITVYCGLAGFSVVVLYRPQLLRSKSNFLFMGLWPLVGAIFTFNMFGESISKVSPTAGAVGLGARALGPVPMAYYWARRNPYFNRVLPEERLAPEA